MEQSRENTDNSAVNSKYDYILKNPRVLIVKLTRYDDPIPNKTINQENVKEAEDNNENVLLQTRTILQECIEPGDNNENQLLQTSDDLPVNKLINQEILDEPENNHESQALPTGCDDNASKQENMDAPEDNIEK